MVCVSRCVYVMWCGCFDLVRWCVDGVCRYRNRVVVSSVVRMMS